VRNESLKACLLVVLVAGLGATALAGAPTGKMTTKPATPAVEKITADQLTAAKSLGVKNAPIMIEDFADFQCPSCKALFEGTTEQLIRDYVQTGKVYLVHHDFPLPMHSHSREAARWANAAAAIGKFEQVEAVLYSQQETWGASGDIEKALSGVLTPAELKRCSALVNNPEIEQAIQKDVALGTERHVNQTPSLFVTHNAKVVPLPPGAVQYSILKQYVDYLLTH
jgi:protein-disulfide isomerase